MLRRVAFVTAILTGLSLTATTAEARATVQVSIHDFSFDPATVTVAQGGTVTWTDNQTGTPHTVTSDQAGIDGSGGFWNSGDLSNGEVYSQSATFLNAGSYRYHCMHHATMHGTVKVPLKASGSAANGFTLRWSSAASTPANRNFDVQVKRPGVTGFKPFRSATTALKTFFNPSKVGTYKFRARTRITSNGRTSDWSPVKTLSIS